MPPVKAAQQLADHPSALKKTAAVAKHVPFGVLRLLMQDAPLGMAMIPEAIIGAPKGASWLLNKAFDTPVLDYDVSQTSGYDFMQDKTDRLVAAARQLLGVPVPEPFSPEYFGELAGSLSIPAGPMAQLLGKTGKAQRYLSPFVDFMVAPHTLPGKAAVGGLVMAPDALEEMTRDRSN